MKWRCSLGCSIAEREHATLASRVSNDTLGKALKPAPVLLTLAWLGSCCSSGLFQMVLLHLRLLFCQEGISYSAGVPCSCLQLGEVLEQILQIRLHALHLSMYLNTLVCIAEYAGRRFASSILLAWTPAGCWGPFPVDVVPVAGAGTGRMELLWCVDRKKNHHT